MSINVSKYQQISQNIDTCLKMSTNIHLMSTNVQNLSRCPQMSDMCIFGDICEYFETFVDILTHLWTFWEICGHLKCLKMFQNFSECQKFFQFSQNLYKYQQISDISCFRLSIWYYRIAK